MQGILDMPLSVSLGFSVSLPLSLFLSPDLSQSIFHFYNVIEIQLTFNKVHIFEM